MEPNNGSKNKTLNPHIVYSLQIPNQIPSYAIFLEKFMLQMLLLHPRPRETIALLNSRVDTNVMPKSIYDKLCNKQFQVDNE